jgi:hypothetical protein
MNYPLAQMTMPYETARQAIRELRRFAAAAFDDGRHADGVRIASVAYRLEKSREYGVPLRTHYSQLAELDAADARQFATDGKTGFDW